MNGLFHRWSDLNCQFKLKLQNCNGGLFEPCEPDPPEMNGLFYFRSDLDGQNLQASAFRNERPLSLLVGFERPVQKKFAKKKYRFKKPQQQTSKIRRDQEYRFKIQRKKKVQVQNRGRHAPGGSTIIFIKKQQHSTTTSYHGRSTHRAT